MRLPKLEESRYGLHSEPAPSHTVSRSNRYAPDSSRTRSVGLGRLDSVSTLLPDPHLFLYSYVRKEAVVVFQIEGTQSSLSDLLLFELEEAPGVPQDEVTDVSNYVAALEYGLERLREGFPLSNRLIREVHAQLLSRGRGSDKLPGEFRRSQNWIGGTRPGNAHFVPPPHLIVEDCMGQLEQFLHDETIPLPMLVKAALAHVQFENGSSLSGRQRPCRAAAYHPPPVPCRSSHAAASLPKPVF